MSRKTLLILALVLVPVAIMVIMLAVETSGPAFNVNFVIAFGLGATATVLLSVGLFALSFHSARSGHDEQVAKESQDIPEDGDQEDGDR